MLLSEPVDSARDTEIQRLQAVIALQRELAASALDVEEVMSVVVRHAAEMTGADAGVVELPEEGEMVYRAVTGSAAGHLGLRLSIETSLSGRCVRTGQTLLCLDTERDERVDLDACRAIGAASMVCVPLRDADATRGVLKVYAGRPGAFDERDVEILGQLSGVIVAHMRLAALYEARAFESRHDLLTDLGNRRAYEERMATEVARAQRHHHLLSIVVLDLDGFKGVNDRHGHPAGDEVLRRVGAAMRHVRRSDDSFRIGGDEFALILAETDEAGARLVAERVADGIRRACPEHRLGASWGVAEYAGGEWGELHAMADARQVQAKQRAGSQR